MKKIHQLEQQFGAISRYLCIRKQKEAVMRNTDYNLDVLGNMISSDTSFKALQDMIKDLDLELEEALAL